MKIQEIKLIHFRNYRELSLKPSAGINIFYGKNGSGKTNVLEAVHYCSLGKSHRVNHDQSVVQFSENESLCQVSVLEKSVSRKIAVQISAASAGKKNILLDEKKISRFSELMGCLQCVIFSPEDLGLIKDGPSVRRKFLDMMISQTNRRYFIALQQYRIGLDQRNALLKTIKIKQKNSVDWLDDFDRTLIQPAVIIIRERKKTCERLNELVLDSYRSISGQDGEILTLAYHCPLKDEENLEEALLQQLKKNREEDIRLGLTSVGPHRDDLIFLLNRKNMRQFASQGQIRTAALSLKIAEMKMIREISGENPVLLLDDVLSELDQRRRNGLLEEIAPYQTFITCTDPISIDHAQRKTFEVSNNEGEGTVVLKEGKEEEEEETEIVSRETLLEDPLFE